jgi:predicted transcriptional regulator
VYATRVGSRRLNVTLDEEHARKLRSLAERTKVQEGTLARSLLAGALDGADPDAEHIVSLLEGMDGAWKRTEEGLAEAARGEGVPLDELA